MSVQNSIIPSYPIPADENERLAALSSYGLMDTNPEHDFDELTSLASKICDTPIALITLIDENRQWFKSAHGADVKETPRNIAFCSHTILEKDQVMMIKDLRQDDRFASNPLVKESPNVVFYAGVSLVNEDGYPLGTLCVIDHKPKELSKYQLDALAVLARQVLTQMELRRKIATLKSANNVLIETNTFIQKFASTVAHDIKNPLGSILLTSEALKKRMESAADERVTRLFDLNISSCNNLIKLVNEMLEYSKTPAILLSRHTHFYLNNLLKEIVSLIVVPENLTVSLPDENEQIHCSSVALEQIFLNLLTNAVRYNDKEQGTVQISFINEHDYYRFRIQDNGPGIASQYLEKIFEKHITLNKHDRFAAKGTGLGLHTVKSLIDKLKGEISVISNIGEGTEFEFTIRKSEI